jgi:hypothetical protein
VNKRRSSQLCSQLELRCESLQQSAKGMKRELCSEVSYVQQRLRLFKKHAKLIEASNDRAEVYLLRTRIQQKKDDLLLKRG